LLSSANPLAPLVGLVIVAAGAVLVSLAIAGHVVAVAVAGAVIAYGIFVWQSRRLARFERSVEDDDE
jgi:Flp pilus assembly protein TadB